MLLKQLTEVYDILDSSTASGEAVAQYLRSIKPDANIEFILVDTVRRDREGLLHNMMDVLLSLEGD